MSGNYGMLPWKPTKETAPWLAEVLEVLEANRDDWPLTQRSLLYLLMGAKAWLKVDEYSPKAIVLADKEERAAVRATCTPGKNLNNILDRGRRAGIIPWEAIASSRGIVDRPSQSEDAESLAWLIRRVIDRRQLDRQAGQARRVVLWIETEGMAPHVVGTAHHYGAKLIAGKGFDVIGRKYDFAREVAELGDVLILHCGDLDKSGHTVHAALMADLSAFVRDLGGRVELKRIALTEQQAMEHCPHACIPCEPGLNGGNHGDGFDSAVECQLEAMPKATLRQIIAEAFEAELDMGLVYEQVDAEGEMKQEALRILADEFGAAQ